jgi:hypothetical protein
MPHWKHRVRVQDDREAIERNPLKCNDDGLDRTAGCTTVRATKKLPRVAHALKLLFSKAIVTLSVRSIMGATDTLRSIEVPCFSEEMPIFSGFRMRAVSAGIVRIRPSLWVAGET